MNSQDALRQREMRLRGELERKRQQIAKLEEDVAHLVDDTNRLNAEADMLDEENLGMRYFDSSSQSGAPKTCHSGINGGSRKDL